MVDKDAAPEPHAAAEPSVLMSADPHTAYRNMQEISASAWSLPLDFTSNVPVFQLVHVWPVYCGKSPAFIELALL